MTTPACYQCGLCGGYFETHRGLSLHRGRSGPEHGKHGTTTTYRRGCRCEECRSANTLTMRLRRAAEGGPKTLEDCLHRTGKACGIPTGNILAALATNSAYALHWSAWRQSGEFRRLCRCDVPDEVEESLEDAEVA